MSTNIRWVMKNKEEKKYFNPHMFPPIQESLWSACFFDSPEQARSTLRRLLSEKFQASKFEAVKIVVSEED